MNKNSIVRDVEVAGLVLLAAIVVGSITFLTANHILPADVSSIADSGMVVTIIGAIFHRLGLKSLPVETLENLVTQFGNAVQQAQPTTSVTVTPPTANSAPAPSVSIAPPAVAQPAPSNVIQMPQAQPSAGGLSG